MIQNSLSMNAVNFQKAKGAPLAIKKNISPNIKQTKGAVMGELGELSDKEYKFLKQAKTVGLTKEEAVAYIQEKRKPTFMEKVGQTTKNIAGGIAGGLPALGPNLAGAAMKGLGTPMFEGYQKAQGENIQPNILQKGGEEMISRGEQMRDIIEKAIGSDPTATATQLSRSVVPIASSIIGSGPLGLTKAGAGAFQTTKAGLTAGSLPTIAKGVAQGAAVGGAEQAMFDIAQSGETTPGNVALGATVGGALPLAVPLIQKGAQAVGKQLSKLPNVGKGVKQAVTRDFPISRIEKDLGLTPTERALVENTGEPAGSFMLRKNIASLTKDKQVNSLQKIADDAYNGITEQVKKIPDRVNSDDAKKMLETMVDEMSSSKILAREKGPYIQKLNEMIQQSDFSPSELVAIKRDFDRIVGNDIFNKAGRVTGVENKIIAGWRNKVMDTIEEMGNKYGLDIKDMNKDVRNATTIRDGLLRRLSQENKNNTFGLQDIGVGAILGQGDPIVSTAVIIAKKGAEKSMPSISQKLYNLSKQPNVPSNLKRGVAITPRDVTDGFSITPTPTGSLTTPGVKTPQTLPPSTKAPLAQSTKATPKLPVAKKTPLKQATDSTKLSPKTTKLLNKTTPLSKVDDALPVGEVMEIKKLNDGKDITLVRGTGGGSSGVGESIRGKGLYLTDNVEVAKHYGKNIEKVVIKNSDILDGGKNFTKREYKSIVDGLPKEMKNYLDVDETLSYEGLIRTIEGNTGIEAENIAEAINKSLKGKYKGVKFSIGQVNDSLSERGLGDKNAFIVREEANKTK